MFQFIWPLALVVLSNIVYQVCAKSVPEGMNPFASLIITYGLGALLSLILFFIFGKNSSLLQEYSKLNWAPIALGFSIVGLEVGWICAYKAGWQISTSFIVQAAILSVGLLIVGYFAYHEVLSWNKLLGVAICLVGLFFINKK